ncbi:MAG: hypothetical protein H0U95_01585 [Bacteroidetes bacterium]|nr:hypothetical protein [Bacteroidota bacterium]
MEQTTQTTTSAVEAPQKPQFLKVLCILSYIGSGLWALISLIGIFASGMIMGMFMGGASHVDTSSMTPEQADAMEKMASAGGGMMGMLSSYITIIFVISLVFAALSLWGVMKMGKLQKGGFWIYAIVNGIFAVLGLLGGGFVGAIIGIAFIVMYGLNLKHMK